MYYEINIALNGQHFFATNERSLTSCGQARAVYDEFKKRFLEKDGFKISVTLVTVSSELVEID